MKSFKPYYKWTAFNTLLSAMFKVYLISFKPYYKWNTFNTSYMWLGFQLQLISFKPCYKWNTFNTEFNKSVLDVMIEVLNLVINGMPSILNDARSFGIMFAKF